MNLGNESSPITTPEETLPTPVYLGCKITAIWVSGHLDRKLSSNRNVSGAHWKSIIDQDYDFQWYLTRILNKSALIPFVISDLPGGLPLFAECLPMIPYCRQKHSNRLAQCVNVAKKKWIFCKCLKEPIPQLWSFPTLLFTARMSTFVLHQKHIFFIED